MAAAPAPKAPPAARPGDTEQWQPLPPVVTPGASETAPPSDAILLFDGQSLGEWEDSVDHTPARWPVREGVFTVDKSLGNIQTRRRFRNYQLHLEWRVPAGIEGSGQDRGNSGVFLASTGPRDEGYEVQILDSYQNRTYVNGQAASVYKQSPPLANASEPPGRWQRYDIVWKAPAFAKDGTLTTPAQVTVFHNGVLVQDHFALKGETVYIGAPYYKVYDRAPIKLQSHHDPSAPISFRNIWVRELPD